MDNWTIELFCKILIKTKPNNFLLLHAYVHIATWIGDVCNIPYESYILLRDIVVVIDKYINIMHVHMYARSKF